MHALGWDARLPEWLRSPLIFGNAPWQWLAIIVATLLAYVVGRAFGAGVIGLLRFAARRTETQTDDELLEASRRPLRLVIAVLVFRVALELMELTPASAAVVSHAIYTLLVIGLGWLIVSGLRSATDWIEERIAESGPVSTHSLLSRRGLRTQLTVLRRVGAVVTVFVGTAVILLQFEVVRQIGVSLLASAGVAGIVVGLAAQKTLGAVIAGVQLSLAQPVRIGDAVTIENEFGEVEEIHLTYVVVKLWDERRLIVPIGRLLDQPFVSWTRTGTPLHGSVYFHVDPKMPLDPVREELERVCAESLLWDKRTASLIVDEATASSLKLRALVSSSNVNDLGDLRNLVREKLVTFVQSFERGKHLPRQREEQVGG
jgi:small-conductance mechanosensitive channel